jgi:hypothetical protein
MTQLLDKARHVNDLWLVGWGCTLRRLPGFRVLESADFREYNTVYDIASPSYLEPAIEWAAQIGAVLFLPRDAHFRKARMHVAVDGWRSVFRTETVAGSLAGSQLTRDHRVSLAPVDENSVDQWTLLYHDNYGMPTELLQANRSRWSLAFHSEPAIRFYFVVVDGELAGTVQLITPGNGVCGIYSLTLPIGKRGLPILRILAPKLIEESIRLGATWACFERLQQITHEAGPPQKIYRMLKWRGLNWETLSRDIGYLRDPQAPLQVWR